MSKNSLFAYLLRSPPWVSFAIAVALALLGRFILPESIAFYALSFAVPFVFIGSLVAWKQRNKPSATRVSATVDAVAGMSWREFSVLVAQAFERDGYVVSPSAGAADFKLVKAGRTVLVSCKRWKAASHGVEALRELDAARRFQEASEALYVTTGTVSDNAQRFAAANRISFVQGSELTALLRLAKVRKTTSAAQ